MTTKSLIETNSYLKDPEELKRLVARSVRSSCGVEGIKPKDENARQIEITHRRPKQIYNKIK